MLARGQAGGRLTVTSWIRNEGKVLNISTFGFIRVFEFVTMIVNCDNKFEGDANRLKIELFYHILYVW